MQRHEKHWNKLQSTKLTLPPAQPCLTRSPVRNDGSPLHVYTDIPHVEEFLTRPEFVISMYYLLSIVLTA